jgi:hypothetical protein
MTHENKKGTSNISPVLGLEAHFEYRLWLDADN